jgi:fructose-bisphosphate aldolase, class II
MPNSIEIMANARRAGVIIPAFNVPYLPMIRTVVRAIADEDSFALIETARPEWGEGGNGGLRAVKKEFDRCGDLEHARLHLDHVPVIDESHKRVDFLAIIREALEEGYPSVMVDGSRLSYEENIEATRSVAEIAHQASAACEAELGRVWGHEAGPPPSYEEMFHSGAGFTDPVEAARFVGETGCDWLSVAVGSIHGSITEGFKDQKKVEARLDLPRLAAISRTVEVPLVLHGGSGVKREFVLEGVKLGIAKMNIGTEIRHAYEAGLKRSQTDADRYLYERTRWILREYLGIADSRRLVLGDSEA